MDLGIKGRWALVCASSKGLGLGCAASLAAEGVNLVMNARSEPLLNEEAKRLAAEYGVTVHAVAGDITTEAIRQKALAAAPQIDILINNAGGPPPGDFDGMIARQFGRVVNITSSAVKAPIDVLALSNGARSGLTGFIAGLSRKTALHNVTINNLLPGMFDTDRLRGTIKAAAAQMGVSEDEAAKRRMAGVPAGRFGNAHEFGQACAYLCSAQASYVTGQNFLIDGGAYPGTF